MLFLFCSSIRHWYLREYQNGDSSWKFQRIYKCLRAFLSLEETHLGNVIALTKVSWSKEMIKKVKSETAGPLSILLTSQTPAARAVCASWETN